ncbi:glucosaminidase domain-containing protein [Mesorhizobium sp. WSM3868]|uniref:glucosaminidase domain-containing protein n=1 Tax=Mesorhizobium sp. WSM3868 TaxID=2029405 RepID=UPI00117F7C95|nr:glucosaminidase domain-containing protein [Mesorhizobium sp. WSM3868]
MELAFIHHRIAGEAGKAFPPVNAARRAAADQGWQHPATVQKALAFTIAAQHYLGVENAEPVPQSVLKDLGGLPPQDLQAGISGLLAGTADPVVKLAMSRQFASAGWQAPGSDRFGHENGRFGQDDGSGHEQTYSYDRLIERSDSVTQLTPDERIKQSSQDDLPTDVWLADLSPGVFGKLAQTSHGQNAERPSNDGADVETHASARPSPEKLVAALGVEEGGKRFEVCNFAANLLAAKGNRKKFVNAFYQAGRSAGLTDTQARLMAAQPAHESGSGNHAPGFNYFGIKAEKSWKGETQRLWTHEEINGHSVRVKQVFRKYATPEEGIRDRIAFMQRRFGKANDATDICPDRTSAW